ncbi:hypothetical protein FHS38_000495 [Streptomyces netropsis]|uniref:Uncharacterized protein n=1 Tax=Streptomyces netropsis TaxID=55404 RepID=A0A7W7L7M3_STRNE|nr:hypothetical protein [Streptomyces netropsis]GGR03358.1 hypothetical protein GCM10010219_04260 [Streptomyces netropsis]
MRQLARVMVLLSSVTSPLRARARPSTTVPVWTAMDVRARMVPLKKEWVPRVAELPTCQNTLQACAPLMRATLLADPVIRVEAIWKMKTALGLPWASSVTVPVRPSDDVDLYTPVVSVCPVRSPDTLAVSARPAASS